MNEKVLIDSSVWINFFRYGNTELTYLLRHNLVLMHSLVIGEIACGTPPSRQKTLKDFSKRPPCQEVTMDEVLEFIEREKLYGLGCNLIDLTLLASTKITPGAKLWTLDRRLAKLAERFHVRYLPTTPVNVLQEEEPEYIINPCPASSCSTNPTG